MKNIIAYSMEKLYKDLEEADELFLSSGMKDMELYEKQLAAAARRAAAEHMAALYSDMDRMLCEDISRAEKYTIQRHDERQLLTTVGPVCFTHTLFRSRKDGTCHYLLDCFLYNKNTNYCRGQSSKLQREFPYYCRVLFDIFLSSQFL